MLPFTLLGLDMVNHCLKDEHVLTWFLDLDLNGVSIYPQLIYTVSFFLCPIIAQAYGTELWLT